jgi:hypothetical protein
MEKTLKQSVTTAIDNPTGDPTLANAATCMTVYYFVDLPVCRVVRKSIRNAVLDHICELEESNK